MWRQLILQGYIEHALLRGVKFLLEIICCLMLGVKRPRTCRSHTPPTLLDGLVCPTTTSLYTTIYLSFQPPAESGVKTQPAWLALSPSSLLPYSLCQHFYHGSWSLPLEPLLWLWPIYILARTWLENWRWLKVPVTAPFPPMAIGPFWLLFLYVRAYVCCSRRTSGFALMTSVGTGQIMVSQLNSQTQGSNGSLWWQNRACLEASQQLFLWVFYPFLLESQGFFILYNSFKKLLA